MFLESFVLLFLMTTHHIKTEHTGREMNETSWFGTQRVRFRKTKHPLLPLGSGETPRGGRSYSLRTPTRLYTVYESDATASPPVETEREPPNWIPKASVALGRKMHRGTEQVAWEDTQVNFRAFMKTSALLVWARSFSLKLSRFISVLREHVC